jgi:hypothetical protein
VFSAAYAATFVILAVIVVILAIVRMTPRTRYR